MQQSMVIPRWDQLPDLTWTEKIAYVTHQMLKLAQTGCPLSHKFEPGLYIREIRVPAGTLLVGREHKRGHLSQLIEGSVVWITPTHRTLVEAPFFLHSGPGDHIVIYAVTDVYARTVHENADECQDISTLEARHFGTADSLQKLGEVVERRLTLELNAA